MVSFEWEKYTLGRRGKIKTLHGVINTPAFIFCATKGTIKGMVNSNVPSNTQILLSNTFHLQEYCELIESTGGIQKFTGWNRPMITDSGGFQIFSLGFGSVAEEIKGIRKGNSSIEKINEKGCFFQSPIDGKIKFLSPEESMRVQIALGVDLVVAFDECTASHASYEYTKESMERSHRWEERSLSYFNKNRKKHQAIYGIVQGGVYKDLRDISIEFVNKNDFFGVCIGGCLGKTTEEMHDIVKYVSQKIDKKKPIHLLGIGKLEDIWELAPYIDTFDCVEPTRIGRHGIAIVRKNRINIKNAKNAKFNGPIDKNCLCRTCRLFSRAYLHYLFKVEPAVGSALVIEHNMFIMNQMMEELRESIETGTFLEKKKQWI